MKPENKPQQATAGPKTRIHNRRTINISLAADQIDKARKIGRGNTSAGVRAAIDEYEVKG